MFLTSLERAHSKRPVLGVRYTCRLFMAGLVQGDIHLARCTQGPIRQVVCMPVCCPFSAFDTPTSSVIARAVLNRFRPTQHPPKQSIFSSLLRLLAEISLLRVVSGWVLWPCCRSLGELRVLLFRNAVGVDTCSTLVPAPALRLRTHTAYYKYETVLPHFHAMMALVNRM